MSDLQSGWVQGKGVCRVYGFRILVSFKVESVTMFAKGFILKGLPKGCGLCCLAGAFLCGSLSEACLFIRV